MVSKTRVKYGFIAVVLVVAGLALADSLGFFNPKPYTAVSMGSHVHYVPKDRAPGVKIDKFPTRKPDADEKITPTGQIVPKDSVLRGSSDSTN